MTEEKLTVLHILKERGSRYGDFCANAQVSQNIKKAMRDGSNWKELPLSMKESLEMIAHKIGRIINGDPYYKDSWIDIIGYAELINQELNDLTED